jgi:hypothetical protein
MSDQEADVRSTETTAEASVTVDQGSAAAQSFHAALPDDLRESPSLAKFNDVSSLAKSYLSAEQMLGSSIRIPSEHASEEDKKSFLEKLTKIENVVVLPDKSDAAGQDALYKKLGRPDSPDGYQIENVPGFDANMVDQFSQLAHKVGLTSDQAAQLVEFEKGRMNQLEEYKNTSQKVLQEKWGNDYNNRMQGAKYALDSYAETFPDAVAQIKASPLGNNPVVIAALSDLGASLKEGGYVSGENKVTYGLTPDEAKARINEVQSNAKHAYFDSSSTKHAEALEYMDHLFKQAYPTQENNG